MKKRDYDLEGGPIATDIESSVGLSAAAFF